MHLIVFREHELDVALHGIGVAVGDVEVAVVDDCIVVADVEHGAGAIGRVLEIGNGMEGVGDIEGWGDEVTSQLIEDDLSLGYVLHMLEYSEVGIERVVGIGIALVACIDCEHVGTGGENEE